MENIFWHELGEDSAVEVSETTDQQYAHACFDGTSREWNEVIQDAGANREGIDKPLKFYIVFVGLRGCYMADNASVFGCKKDALSCARFWIEQDEEQSEEESEA